MKKLLLFFVISLVLNSCDDEVSPPDLHAKITARQNVTAVVAAAKQGFAPDAELAGIYGRNVSTSGDIDLLNTNSLNAFVYIMQSDASVENEFYVPVYAAGPVKSPINFNTMTSYIKDPNAQSILGGILGSLATINIIPDAYYYDSPVPLTALLSRDDVIQFRSAGANSSIDMFLFPSKAIDPDSGLTDTADWVVNFYNDTASLVLWIRTNDSRVTVLSN